MLNTVKKLYKKGFTLLELLVVVLIIGILAAIALPQYQLAIDKTKFANYQTMVKALSSAFRQYTLNHKDFSPDFKDLDIELPSGYTETTPYYASCAVFKDFYCCIAYPKKNYQNGSVICGNNDATFALQERIISSSGNSYLSDRVCIAQKSNSRAVKLCENIPYKNKVDAHMLTPFSYESINGYTAYYIK